MNESDKKFSVYQARVVLQYLNDQVYQQTDRVKLIEDNLSQCQRWEFLEFHEWKSRDQPDSRIENLNSRE